MRAHACLLQELLAFWCTEQGHTGTAKCKQMEFGKKMSQTDSGEVRVFSAILPSPLPAARELLLAACTGTAARGVYLPQPIM